MAAAPRLITPAYEVHGEERHSLGDLDLTEAIALVGSRNYEKVRAWMAGVETPRVIELSTSMPERMLAIAMRRQLLLPTFKQDLENFLTAVPDMETMARLLKHLNQQRASARDIGRSEELLSVVRAARFEQDTSLCDHFVDVSMERYFPAITDAIEAAEEDFYREFSQELPEPDYRTPAHAAWEEEFHRFLRARACPFVFATRSERWEGISADDVLERLQEGEELTDDDVDNMIEDGLCSHHEDARDAVVDEGELFRILDEWKAARTSGFEDYDLSEKLEAWNRKQDIVSFYPDQKVIFPLFEDITHEDAVRWCEQKLERKKALQEEQLNSWAAPEAEPERLALRA